MNEQSEGTLRGCKPALVERLASPIIFTTHAGSLLAIFMSSVVYFSGILTTIERQFELSSSEVGAITVINDASSMCLILFVTYFGHRSHRPRWVACGAIIVGIGLLVCSLPHYLSDPIDPQSLIAGGTYTASQKSPVSMASQVQGTCGAFASLNGTNHEYQNTSDPTVLDKCQKQKSDGIGPVKWIVVGQIIMGCGSAPLFPLILSYIDDAVKMNQLTSYTAVFFIAITLGPIGGFFLTTAATSTYVDFDRIPTDQIPDLPDHDPRWIGAWWLGFPILSALLILISIPMLFYPKTLTPNPKTTPEAPTDLENDETADTTLLSTKPTPRSSKTGIAGVIESLKGVLLAIKRLVFNAALMFLCLGASSETALNALLSTFQIKYLQTQFGTSPAKASLLAGGVIVPCVTVAQVVSAVICRKFKFHTKQCVRFVVGCHCVALICTVAQLYIGCKNPPVAGVDTPYSANDRYTNSVPNGVSITPQYPPTTESYQRTISKLESPCNKNCSCPEEIFRPVCGADGVSYISPCHAGCTQFNTSGLKEYSQCSCVSGRNSSFGGEIEGSTAVSGICRDECNGNTKLTLYILFLALGVFCTSLTLNPVVFSVFRVVDTGDKSIALGLKNLMTKCLGLFPAPIIIGVLINSTCILWQYTCGERGSCWLYDMTRYRQLFVGVPVGLKVITIICYASVLFVLKPESKKEKNEDDIEQKNLQKMDA